MKQTELKNVYSLLDKDCLNNKAIQKLIEHFRKMIPDHFKMPYFVPSPIESLPDVIRANCGKPNCSVRAVVHVIRGLDGRLIIKEEKPIFDRLSNPCDQCQGLS